jgi:hypothetical protein
LTNRTGLAPRAARAHDLLANLQRGESIHIASAGELSVQDVLSELARLYGPFEALTCSSWSVSEQAARELLALREGRAVARLEILVDTRLPADFPDVAATLESKFDLFAAAPCHAKVFAFTGKAPGIAILSTANLTFNPRAEAVCISADEDLAQFHKGWIHGTIEAAKRGHYRKQNADADAGGDPNGIE